MDRIDDNVIVGTKTGITSKIVEKNGMYVHPMTITRKKKKNDMDIGNLGMIESTVLVGYQGGKIHSSEHSSTAGIR